MSTNCVVFTDLHIDKPWPNPRVQTTLNAFLEEMREVRPNIIMNGGDTFHTKRPRSEFVEFAAQWFMELSKCCDHLVIIPGGHDQDIPAGTTAVDFLDDIAPNITIVYEPSLWEGMLLMPYMRRLTPEQIAIISEADIMLLHQGIDQVPLDNGKRMYGNTADAVPYEALEHARLAIFGHMHTPWKNNKNVYVLGSPYQTLYSHALVGRHYMMFDMETPEIATLFPFPGTFYLKELTINIKNTMEPEDFIKKLPAWTQDTYLSITVGVEGPIKTGYVNELKHAISTVYGNWVDSVSVLSVLSTSERALKHDIIQALSVKSKEHSPYDLLNIWMEKKGEAYFKTNPALTQAMHEELRDIMAISESNK